jgi:hypothetical protein
MSRFTNDVDNMQMMLEQSMVQLISSVFSFIGIVAMMILPEPADVRNSGYIPCNYDFIGYKNRQAIKKIFPQSAGKSGLDERKY